MLNVVILRAIKINFFMLVVIIINVVTLSVFMLKIVMLGIYAKYAHAECHYDKCP